MSNCTGNTQAVTLARRAADLRRARAERALHRERLRRRFYTALVVAGLGLFVGAAIAELVGLLEAFR